MSLIEVLIASLIITTIVLTASGLYLLGQRTWVQGVLDNANTQTSRFLIDRVAREARQANEIVTADSGELFFEDGHDDRLQYIRYYLTSDELKRQQIIYKKGNNLVRYDTPGANQIIEEEELIGERITGLNFVDNNLIEITINGFSSKVYPKNAR